jgi:hypothetical protein
MAFDDSSTDAAFIAQGLHGIEDVPPLLFLDREALERIGRNPGTAPCDVVDVESGSVFIVRPDPFEQPSDDDLRRVRAFKKWIGMASGAPLRLLPTA